MTGPVNKVGIPPPADGSAGPCPFCVKPLGTRKDILNDVIQGSSLDCFVMAALYSVAWRYYPNFPANLHTDANGNYTIPIYSIQPPPKKSSQNNILVRPTMPMNSSSVMIFAQQTPDNCELWPALYEKAYAIWALDPSTDLGQPPNTVPGANPVFNTPPRDPDVGQLTQGDPLTALTAFTPYLYTFRSDNNNKNRPSAFNTNKFPVKVLGANYATSYDILNAFDIANTATMNPTVAWTYGSEPAGYPGYYGNTALIANHAYSILGTVTIKNNYYIILRNPFGAKIDPINDTGLAQVKASLAAGSWSPDGGTTQITLGDYGIFGFEKTAFDTCFAGFGWTEFTTLTS
jgi:hypothetical protein